jgi:aminopeptidase
MDEKEIKKIAKQIVKSLLIGKKENPGIKIAMKKYPSFLSFLKKYRGKFIPRSIVEKNEWLKDLMNPKYGPLIVKRKVKGREMYVIKDKIGESVRIMYHPENWKLAKEIIIETIKSGAHPSWTCDYSELEKEIMKISKIENLEELPTHTKNMLESFDVRIKIESEDDPTWESKVESWKFRAGMDIRQYMHEVLDKRKTKWVYVGWPFDKVADYYGVSRKWYRKMIFDSIKESFSRRTIELANFYEKALRGKDKVKIVSIDDDPTDLELRIKGRKILKDIGYLTLEGIKKGDVGLNIPSGEVFCAPLEDSANGKIFFKKIFIHGKGFVNDLYLEFKNGKVVYFEEKDKEKNFEKLLNENTESSKVIAELGIGCNRGAKYSGYILTDEKIFGTIHIAIGNNTGAYGGKNKASMHLDMVKDMKNCRMYVDGKLVMDRGLPVIR